MDYQKWMDLDGSWVYSTNPRRQPDSSLKYNTLPGGIYNTYRDVDVSRKPVEDRGKYGTIPGRFVNREPVSDTSPYRQWSTSRMPQSIILQDSTNWDPFLPPRTRSSTFGRLDNIPETRIDARIRDRLYYDWQKDLSRKQTLDYERKRQKSPRNLHAEKVNCSLSTKRRQNEKLVKMDPLCGEWKPPYTMGNKLKSEKYNEWEPLTHPPKALQNQLLSKYTKMELQQSGETESPVVKTDEIIPEKKKWWSKLVKQSKPGVTNAVTSEAPQDKSSKISMKQGSLANNVVHKQEVFKENFPQIRKRKGPPPYVPPPSYDYPHRTFPIHKEKLSHTRGSYQNPISQTSPMNDSENWLEIREKIPRYSTEQPKTLTSNLTITNFRENRVKEKQFDPSYQTIMEGRKLPQTYCTWTGSKSDDFLDHIYEIVEGGSIPPTTFAPTFTKKKSDGGLQTDEMIYGTVSLPLQREPSKSYTLPRTSRKEIHDGNETIRRKTKNTINYSQQQLPPFDVRPPIPLHGVKLPRELGFSYTSGKLRSMDKKIEREYKIIKESDNGETGHGGRRPLRVMSSKELKTNGPSDSFSNKMDYNWHSHTLPLKKDYRKTYMKEEATHNNSRNKMMSSQDTDFPKWREPGKISTMPTRAHNRQRYEDGLKLNKKSELPRALRSEPSNIHNTEVGRRRQPKEYDSEIIHSPVTKESDGMFVIDATCVIVRAEYIFPPIMEQVTFLHKGASQGDILSNKANLGCVKDERTSHLSLYPSRKTSIHKTHSISQHYNELPKEKSTPNLKERAIRILGLPMGEIDTLNEDRDNNKTNIYNPEAVNRDKKLGPQEQEFEISNEKRNANSYRKESKARNCNEMPCILEVPDLPAVSSEAEANMQLHLQTSLYNNVTVDNHELIAQKSMLITNIPNINITEPSNINAEYAENSATTEFEENHGCVQEQQLNDHISLMEVDSSLPEENNFDVTKLQSKDDRMELEISLNETLVDDKRSNVAEQTCNTSTQTVELNFPEKQEQVKCMLVEAKEEHCLAEKKDTDATVLLPMRKNEQHLSESQEQLKSFKYPKDAPVLQAELGKRDDQCLSQHWQRGNDICLNPETQQASLHKPTVKVYARKPNFYAKDLREAVSRIRRHTAPDSDTDEDLEKPIVDSINTEQVPEECGTSYSSDTSDSEVTVIFCETEKEEETISMSKKTNVSEGINGQSTEEVTTLDMEAEFQSVTLKGDATGEQSNIFHPNEEAVFDLNSCINEILQDLSKTEQEFFPDEDDN